jgi:polyketide biosynthesis acyl carrier protein
MNKQEIFQIVINNTLEVLPDLEGHNFQYTDKLVDLGANSIDRAEIVAMTMEALNLQIPRVELAGVKNIGELVEVLHEKMQSI